MSSFLKLTIFIAALVTIQGCSSSDTVKSKEQEWLSKLELFQPIGKTPQELFEWQKDNNVPLNSFPHSEGIILETINGDGFVCSTWHIFLSTQVDSNNKISDYSISSAGSCL